MPAQVPQDHECEHDSDHDQRRYEGNAAATVRYRRQMVGGLSAVRLQLVEDPRLMVRGMQGWKPPRTAEMRRAHNSRSHDDNHREERAQSELTLRHRGILRREANLREQLLAAARG